MKKIFLFLTVISLISFSCENDLGIDPSEVTYFPKMVMQGKSVIKLECNAPSFADPGVTALEGEKSVEVKVNTHGRYYGSTSINGADVYDIAYTATNVDGIPGSISRTVYIPPCNGDFINNIEGVYESTVVRNGVVSPQYQGLQYVYIKKVGNNVYQLSDAIGGYYDFGRDYGSDYAFVGMKVTANNLLTNDFSFGSPIEGGAFGGPVNLTSFSMDASTKTIIFSTKWVASTSTYNFIVTLTQVQ